MTQSIEKSTDSIIESMNRWADLMADLLHRVAALEGRRLPDSMPRMPDAALIEIVERGPGAGSAHGVIIPNEVRVNGVPLLCSEDPIVVHETEISSSDAVRVTLTLLARRVVIGSEPT